MEIWSNSVFKKQSFYACLLLFFLIQNAVLCSAFTLSKQAEVSILTCSPGNESYSVYGHSAIRVNDALNDYDVVFNYGIFNFNTPNFLYRFAKGETDYLLGAYDFSDFYEEYVAEERSVFEQILDLKQEEKTKNIRFFIMECKTRKQNLSVQFLF